MGHFLPWVSYLSTILTNLIKEYAEEEGQKCRN